MLKKIEISLRNFLKTKYLFWIVLALVFIIARLATWFYPFDSDHWIFWYIGKKILNGEIPYLSAWDHKPPLIFYFNALLNFLFGGNLVLHRIFFTFLTFLDIYLFYRLAQIFAKRFYPEKTEIVARVGLILYVFFRNLSQFASSGNNTENVGLIFLMLMFLAFFRFREKKNLRQLFLSGICLSVLFFLKGNFLLLSLPIFIELSIESYKNFKNFLIRFTVFLLPLILQAIFWVLYFQFHNALRDFLVASFFFSSSYAKSAWLGKVSSNQLLFLEILSPFAFPLILFIYRFFKDFNKISRDFFYRFLFFSLVFSIIFGLAIGSFYAYYFLILFPTFILVILYSSDIFFNFSKFKNLIIISIFVLGIAGCWLISMKQFYNFFKGPVRVDYEEYTEIASYIKANSQPTDKIEAYVYGATLYRMAERDAASRFISASILLLDERENYGFNFTPTFIEDLQKSKPKYWIISSDKNNLYYQNKEIISYMESNFVLDKIFPHYLVLKYKTCGCEGI